MNVTAWQFRESGWGRGVAAGVALIALACVDRGSPPRGRRVTGWFTRWQRSPQRTCRSWLRT